MKLLVVLCLVYLNNWNSNSNQQGLGDGADVGAAFSASENEVGRCDMKFLVYILFEWEPFSKVRLSG